MAWTSVAMSESGSDLRAELAGLAEGQERRREGRKVPQGTPRVWAEQLGEWEPYPLEWGGAERSAPGA